LIPLIKRRGIYIAIGGIALVVVSFGIVMSIVGEFGSLESEFSLPEFLEGMFDQVSEKTQIMPGEAASFSFDVTDSTSVLWGMQIFEHQRGDSVVVSISNIFGDDFGTYEVDQATFFETMKIEKSDNYNFNVKNTGTRPINIVMMFTKNPDDSQAFSDPDSPISKTIVPLAVSGILFIVGIIVLVAGIVIVVFDYRKKRAEF
jgi:hypothetical protein